MRRMLAVALLALFFAPFVSAQNTASLASSPINVTLGHSAIALDGPWRFHIGDNPQWSDPAFDDSAWETTSVGATADSYDPNQGTQGWVSGWTAKGHPGYSGFAWYRARVHLDGATGSLAILAPSNVDDSYQLFVNGHLLGSFGNFNRRLPSVYIAQPRMFRIPASILRPDGTMDIAFRFYMAPLELVQIDPGGMHGPPYLGFTEAINPVYHVQMEQQFLPSTPFIVTALIVLVFALLIFMLFAFDRSERILLLPLAGCLLTGVYLLIITTASVTYLLPATSKLYAEALMLPALRGVMALAWWAYFGLQSKKWIRNFVFIIAAFSAVTSFAFVWVTTNGLSVPHSVFTAQAIIGDLDSAAVIILIALILWFGVRKAQKLDWMLLLATVFYAVPELTSTLRALHLRTSWFPVGIDVSLGLLASLASIFCFSFVLMGRFRASQRRQQTTLEEVKQAQEVQQILIPRQFPKIPGLNIESEYRPAREVGGDFFHIQPAGDGSALIVTGDVSGKGLKAAMTVSAIIGALRNEPSRQPAQVLNNLNRILHGNITGFAACTAALISASGSLTLANAGNLAPYLNGQELRVDSGLPLGILADSAYSETTHHLNPNDRLTFISDGVVEATNPQRELFGFDRTQAISNQPASTIAATAQTFGQQDDISVLSITRTAVREHVLA